MITAELVEKLDEKWRDWTMHRGCEGDWIVHLPTVTTLRSETIEDVLRQASEYVALPNVPRRPRQPEPYSVKKCGSKWSVHIGQNFCCGNIGTKRKAQEVAERFLGQDRQRYSEWMRDHSEFVDTHTEGVDFRWME